MSGIFYKSLGRGGHVKHPFPNRNNADGDITCHDNPLLLLGDNCQLAHGQLHQHRHLIFRLRLSYDLILTRPRKMPTMFIFPTPFPTHPLIFSQMAGKRAWGAWENLQKALSLYYLCTRIRKRFHGLSQRQKWWKVLHTTPYRCKVLYS